MTKLLALLALAGAVATLGAAVKSKLPQLNDGDTILCPMNLVCDIELNDTTSLTGTVRYGGDKGEWEVIADHGPPAQIIIKPKKLRAFTNVLIPTSEGLHVVFVQAVEKTSLPTRWALALEHDPTPTPLPTLNPRLLAPPPTPTPPPTMLSYIDMPSFHCDNDGSSPATYRVSGSAEFRPVRVCVDVNRTYIEIPRSAPVPALSEVGPGGDIEYIEPHFDFDASVFVDPAHRQHYLLVRGSGRSMQEIHIDLVGPIQRVHA